MTEFLVGLAVVAVFVAAFLYKKKKKVATGTGPDRTGPINPIDTQIEK